jgi:hypothetical protein
VRAVDADCPHCGAALPSRGSLIPPTAAALLMGFATVTLTVEACSRGHHCRDDDSCSDATATTTYGTAPTGGWGGDFGGFGGSEPGGNGGTAGLGGAGGDGGGGGAGGGG